MVKKRKVAKKKGVSRNIARRKVKPRITVRRASRIAVKRASPRRKQTIRKPVIRKKAVVQQKVLTIREKEIGIISHYFPDINVGIIELTQGQLQVGNKIHVKGNTTDFTQRVESLQFEHKPIQTAQTGQSIGMKMSERVREHDKVYKVE